MPKFGSVLSSLQAKLEEARVSNLNYELGRFVQDTKCYLSSTFKGPGNNIAGIPKSTSLPLFPAGYNKRVSDSNKQGKLKYCFISLTPLKLLKTRFPTQIRSLW